MGGERTLRYLSRADVRSCLPPIGGQIDLAEEALIALAQDQAEAPARSSVHPRPESSLHAMPAWIRLSDTVGLKWVSGYPGNPARGLPDVTALIVVNDAETGVPLCVMDGTEITARRTAAVSGAAVRLFAPPPGGPRETEPSAAGEPGDASAAPAYRVAFIGTGQQARVHFELLSEILGPLQVLAFDALPERATAFAEEAAADAAGVEVKPDALSVCEGADLLVSAVSSSALGEGVVEAEMLAPHCLVLTLDRAIMVTASVAEDAGLFVVDDLAQFLHVRDVEERGWFAGYPRPHGSLGRALLADERIASGRGVGVPAPATEDPNAVSRSSRDAVAAALGGRSDGRILLASVGVGAVDVVTAGAVFRVAQEEGIGAVLAV